MERESTIEKIYREERGRLISALSQHVGNDMAEDIFHDVVARAVANMDALEPIRDLAAWLWTAARNAVIDAWRKRSRRGELGESDFDGFESWVDSAWESTQDELEREELLSTLAEAIEALPVEQRDVIVCQALKGETFAAMAARTGVAPETLAARKRYAMAKLRSFLADHV